MSKLGGATLLCTLFFEAFCISLHGSTLPTTSSAMRSMQARKGSSTCLAEAGVQGGFGVPANGFSQQLRPGGRVFFIGDDAVSDLCEKGSPGLCCSALKPCLGAAALRDASGQPAWEVWYEKTQPGWVKLRQYSLRSRSETALTSPAYVLMPEIPRNASQVPETTARIASFLSQMKAGPNDVLVVGLVGRESTRSLAVYDALTSGLIKSVVNTFTGRAVLLSASPSHPTEGLTARSGKSDACMPAELPGEKDPPINSFQNAIFVFNVWSELVNPRARLIDVHDMLLNLGKCHRDAECRTWNDDVIAMTAQLALNGLEKIRA